MQHDIWIALGRDGLISNNGAPSSAIIPLDAAMLAAGPKSLFCACREKGQVLRLPRNNWLFASPGLEAMAVSANERYLFQLSGDADSLACVDTDSGEPLFLVPCGCYPRAMHLHPSRSLLAAAAGATGEILVFETPQLTPYALHRLPGVANAVAFVKHGLAFLSAVEKGDIHTLLGLIHHQKGSYEELALFKGIPGTLYPLQDGTLILSVSNLLMRIRLRPYKILWQKQLEGLITHIDYHQGQLLLSDSAMGTVSLLPLAPPRQETQIAESSHVHAVFGPHV